MRIFGLIGNPLGHSFSAKYFSAKFAAEGITGCRYELFPLADISELPALLQRYPDIEGLNVTIPYKSEVMSYLQIQDPIVTDIGACNCIRFRDGVATGFNTDAAGFEQSLREGLQPVHQSALVLGTGGASKAVVYVLRKLGIACQLVSRTASNNTLSYDSLSPELIAEHKVIINTTPLGTAPDTDKAPLIPYHALTSSHFLFDLVYNPAKTLFLQKGEERGATIRNGSDMLKIQAEESWKIWNS